MIQRLLTLGSGNVVTQDTVTSSFFNITAASSKYNGFTSSSIAPIEFTSR